MITASAPARAKDYSRNAFSTAEFAEFQIKNILSGPEPGATVADHLLALLASIEVDPDLKGKLLRSRILKATAENGCEPSCGYTAPVQIIKLLTAPNRETTTSCLRALLNNIAKDSWAIDDALDFVTAQIRRSARKKPRLRY